MLKFLYGDNVKQTKGFTLIDWGKLVALCNEPKKTKFRSTEEAKIHSAIIAAHDGNSKKKLNVLEHNNFTLLRLDLDDVDYSINEVKEKLLAVAIDSFIIHSTAKHLQDGFGNRYRVYIEIKQAVTFDVWALMQTYLSEYFNADNCATRPQQIMYLPTQYTGMKFECLIGTGEPLDLTDTTTQLYKDAIAERDRLEAEKEVIKKDFAHIETAPTRIDDNATSIIDLVNSSFSWDMILTSSGFSKHGNKWLSPNQTSATPGGVILTSNTDGKERFYSHSESDQSIYGNRAIDKFEFLMVTEYGGDQKTAVREMATAYFPEVDKNNKREYMINKNNEQVVKELEGIAC